MLAVSVVVVGALLLFVFPTRTLVEQRHQIAAVRHEIALLDAENAHLRHEAADLQRPATIERIAREEFGLVMKGEKAYAVLPPPSAAARRSAPAAHPAGSARTAPAAHEHWWRSLELWRDL